MRVLNKRSVAAVTIPGLVAVALLLFARSSLGSTPPLASAADLQMFGLTATTDVTDNPVALNASSTKVTSDDAVNIAAQWLSRGSTTGVRVLHGPATPVESEPERSVWVILFPGGELPVIGPPGASTSMGQARFTGVEVDDQTGEVLTWFMR